MTNGDTTATCAKVVSRLPLRFGSRGRRLTARTGSVLDAQADGHGHRPGGAVLALSRLTRQLDARKRVGDANGNADQTLELGREPAAGRPAAGDEDLADAQRVRLLLVEAKRGDQLARQDLELGRNRPARFLGLARAEAGRVAFLA